MKASAVNTAALLAAAATFGALADDPVYVTGEDVEYGITSTALTVSNGVGTLVLKTPTGVNHLWVMEGASLKLATDDDPFSTSPVLHVFGTLDVNGMSFSALRLDNRTEVAATNRTTCGRIVNTSETASSIRLTSDAVLGCPYFGTFEERPGRIAVTSENTTVTFRGPTGDSPASGFTFSARSVLAVEDRPTKVKFVFYPPADATKPIRLAEIGLTGRGAPVPNKSATASSQDADHPVSGLIDNVSSTYWSAAEAGEQTVEIETHGVHAVDGYRITPYDGTPASAVTGDPSYRPSGWDVYVWRNSLFRYVLVDSRHDFADWYPHNGTTSTTNMQMSAIGLFGNPFGEGVSITLNNTASNYAAKVSGNETIRVGTLASKGDVFIADGSTFAPGDISESTGAFIANGSTAERIGTLELSARGGAEQPLSITSPQNLMVVNGGAEPVSVLLDDSRAGEHLFGKLSDGANGQLGLVKRGNGERVIETEDAAYSGPTVVHGGTLTVARKRAPVTARYIKITPTATHGTYNADYPWGMNEFQLLDADGNAVAWPSGTTVVKIGTGGDHSTDVPANLVDGKSVTRALFRKDNSGTYTYPPALIDTVAGVTFSAYRWWSPHGHSADASRTPVEWKIEVSDDNVNWKDCDIDAWGWTAADGAGASSWTGAYSVERGPFAIGTSARSLSSGLHTLNAPMFAAGTSRDTHRKLKAQYFRFRVFETVNPYGSPDAWGWQLTEIGLMKDGERVNWPAGTTSALQGSTTHSANMLSRIHNNVIWTNDGGAVATADRCFVRTLPSAAVINAHEQLEFDAYSLTTTSPQSSQGYRMPRTWTMEVSLDGSTYTKIDSVTGYTPVGDVLTGAYQEMGPFPVADKWPLLHMGAGDSLGDRSPVAISNNATLKLATDYEKFGPLSGAGTLDLVWDAVGEINACAPAKFSGSVTGRGTLAVCGDDVQTFDGATLSGANTLELNGGAIAGSASFGGSDVTVAFNGGATRAALSGIGTLTVTGDVKYALPVVSDGADAYSVTLFSANSISAESRARLAGGTCEGEVANNWRWTVSVTDTAVELKGFRQGLMLIFK